MVPLDDVKGYLKITVDTSDAELQLLIDRLTEMIEREVGWYFREPRPIEEVLDGGGTDRLFLRQEPDDGTAVVVSSRSGPTDTWDVVDAADYEVEGRGLFVSGIWARGRRNYRVAYAEGFDCPPGDVSQLLLEMAAAIWGRRERGKGLTGLTSERIGDYAYQIGGTGSGDSILGGNAEEAARWDATLNRWRRKRL